MIKFEGVSKIYPPSHLKCKETVALDNVCFEVKEKEFVLITGRSGAGKTTVIKLLIGEEKPTKGEVFFDGLQVNKLVPKDLPRLRRQIGIVFQDYKLLSKKTVFENVAYALEVTGAETERVKAEVPYVLKVVGLENRAEHLPAELSGGEKQRLAIARAMVHRPKVLVADEPTGNLDPYCTWDIIKLFTRINELGTTVILATHDQEIVNNLDKRVISLEKGRVIKDAKKGKYII